MKDALGDLTGNSCHDLEGKADQLEGKAQQRVGDAQSDLKRVEDTRRGDGR